MILFRARVVAVLPLVAVILACPSSGNAADLSPATTAAFERYVQVTEARMDAELANPSQFLWTDTLADADRSTRLEGLRQGALIIERLETKEQGRTLKVPNGLVHHWLGVAFLPGATVDRTLQLLQDYDHHASIYAPRIARSQLRSHDGDTFLFHIRFFMKKVITVVIDTENTAHFSRPAPDRAYSRIVSTRMAEVDQPGTPSERQKPVGRDSGYLWRLNTYWRLLERDGGTYLQCESVSLSRGIPTGLGWLIGPFVTSLPRESLEFTMNTTRQAVSTR